MTSTVKHANGVTLSGGLLEFKGRKSARKALPKLKPHEISDRAHPTISKTPAELEITDEQAIKLREQNWLRLNRRANLDPRFQKEYYRPWTDEQMTAVMAVINDTPSSKANILRRAGITASNKSCRRMISYLADKGVISVADRTRQSELYVRSKHE